MDAAIRERADLFADVWTARINALGSAGRIDDLMHEFDRVWHIAPGQMNAAGMAVYWLVHHGHFDVAADVIDLLRNLDGLDRGQRGVIEEVARRLMDLEREASGALDGVDAWIRPAD